MSINFNNNNYNCVNNNNNNNDNLLKFKVCNFLFKKIVKTMSN